MTNTKGTALIDSGWVNLENAGTKIFIQIDGKTLNTQNAMRDEHIKAADFFDVTKYPKITFEAAEIVKNAADSEYGYLAKGKLTIKDKTVETNIPFNYMGMEAKDMGDWGKFNVGGFEGKAVINRTQFGIGEGGGLGENVTINITLEVMQPAK